MSVDRCQWTPPIIDGFAKSHISPPLAGGDKGEGGDNYLKYRLYSPSPQPSPIEGEGVFWTFYESIIIELSALSFLNGINFA